MADILNKQDNIPTFSSDGHQFDSFATDEIQSLVNVGDLVETHLSFVRLGKSLTCRKKSDPTNISYQCKQIVILIVKRNFCTSSGTKQNCKNNDCFQIGFPNTPTALCVFIFYCQKAQYFESTTDSQFYTLQKISLPLHIKLE